MGGKTQILSSNWRYLHVTQNNNVTQRERREFGIMTTAVAGTTPKIIIYSCTQFEVVGKNGLLFAKRAAKISDGIAKTSNFCVI